MNLNRPASQLGPLLFRSGTATAFRRSTQLPRYTPALAILVSRHALSTDTSTSGNSNNSYPPPGFNAEQAKKPLSSEKQSQNTSQQASSSSSQTGSAKADTSIPTAEPTENAPTRAAEKQSLKELPTPKEAAQKQADGMKVEKKKEEDKKLTIRQKIMREVHHYWDGTKLLGTEVKISSKLALKMAAGYELTRREHRQFHRTVQDLGRLVPFSVFVIVPFAELLLPIALRLFPNLLPSTYEGAKSKEAKVTGLRATRKEVSNFLRQTLKESGLPVSAANAQKEEFTDFFKKVRATGEEPNKSDIIRVCKIFKDDLTLDNLSRPQLVGMCRYMGLTSFGTDAMLRYQIRHRMRQLKRDDRAIAYEGVESLSVTELQNACAARGLRTQGMSPGRLRDDLHLWLDLRLKHGIPSTLLVLSNAFMYAQGKETEFDTQIDALQAVLASIPEELFHEIELEVHTAEGAATNKQRLEVLKEQQELIDEENEQSEAQRESGKESQVSDREDIDEKDEEARQGAVLEREREADMVADSKPADKEAAVESSSKSAEPDQQKSDSKA